MPTLRLNVPMYTRGLGPMPRLRPHFRQTWHVPILDQLNHHVKPKIHTGGKIKKYTTQKLDVHPTDTLHAIMCACPRSQQRSSEWLQSKFSSVTYLRTFVISEFASVQVHSVIHDLKYVVIIRSSFSVARKATFPSIRPTSSPKVCCSPNVWLKVKVHNLSWLQMLWPNVIVSWLCPSYNLPVALVDDAHKIALKVPKPVPDAHAQSYNSKT